jgi:hypothetical protein
MADEMIEQIWSILTAHRKPSSPHPSEPRLPPSFDLDSDQEIVPIIPETPTLYDDPTLTETPKPFESIATRRTRRSGAGNVYYKEPSLRTALSPGDPYTFSVEDGIVTPTIPTGYNRKTPVVDQRSRRMTGRK